jgi:hypothetical protein
MRGINGPHIIPKSPRGETGAGAARRWYNRDRANAPHLDRSHRDLLDQPSFFDARMK